MVTIFSKEFWCGIKNFAMNYKDNRQCKVDWCCRVVFNDGDSIFDVCRASGSAKDFVERLLMVNKKAYSMGIINENRLKMQKEYIKDWESHLTASIIGWWIVKKVMCSSETNKKKWVKEMYDDTKQKNR